MKASAPQRLVVSIYVLRVRNMRPLSAASIFTAFKGVLTSSTPASTSYGPKRITNFGGTADASHSTADLGQTHQPGIQIGSVVLQVYFPSGHQPFLRPAQIGLGNFGFRMR